MTDRPLQILLHFQERFAGWGGGLNYLRAVMAALDRQPAADRPDILVFDDLPAAVGATLRESWALPVVATVLAQDGIILQCRDDGARATLEALPPSARRRALARQADAIYPVMPGDPYPVNPKHWLWVPDFQHRYLPQFFTTEDWDWREARFQDVLARPCPLILSSQAALDDLRLFYPDHAARPHVWHFRSLAQPQTAERLREVRQRYGLPSRFLFIPNQFWGHKDHATAFRALALLRDRGVEIELICTGGKEDHRDPGHYDRLFTQVADGGLQSSIRHLGSIPHGDVMACLQMATCILQPSRFEGWSTLVEDTLALGVPLVATDLPVHLEQIGQAGHFFPPGDAEALAALLARILPGLPDSPPETKVLAAAAAYDALRAEAGAALLALLRAEQG